MKHISNMTSFVKEHGEAELARLMHEAIWSEKTKRCRFGNPGNRKGKQMLHITKRIDRVKRFKGDFSVSDVADNLSICRGSADWVVKTMLKDNQIHRVPQLGGESEFRYKVDRGQNAN